MQSIDPLSLAYQLEAEFASTRKYRGEEKAGLWSMFLRLNALAEPLSVAFTGF